MRLLVLVLLSLGWTGSAFGQPLSGVWHGRLEPVQQICAWS